MLLGFFFRTRGNRGRESRQIFDGILSGKFNHENFSGQLFADSQTKWLFVLIAEGILGFSVQNIIATNAKWYCVVIVSTCAYQSKLPISIFLSFFSFLFQIQFISKKTIIRDMSGIQNVLPFCFEHFKKTVSIDFRLHNIYLLLYNQTIFTKVKRLFKRSTVKLMTMKDLQKLP